MQKNKLLELVIAIVSALFLWIFVVTTITTEDDITIPDIPVVFHGESELRSEHELIITNRSALTVTIKFHGARSDLKRLEENKSGLSAVLDVSQFTSEREYSASYEIKLPSALQDDDIQIMDRTPRNIQFTVERLDTRQVPVKGVFDGTLADGYVQGDLIFDQNTVRVTGPAALVENVNYAQVVVGGDNISDTFTRSVSITLISASGEPLRSNDLTVSTQEIQVTLPVWMEKELKLTVTPIYGAGATEKNTKIEIQPATITVRGPKQLLRDLEEVNLGELDLRMISDGETLQLPIELNGLTPISEQAAAAVTVDYTGLEILPISDAQIVLKNLADEMTASILTDMLTVYLRGESEDLIELTDAVIIATADLAEYNLTGVFTVPVTVSTGHPSVGAVGEYTVTVELGDWEDTEE